LLQKNFEINFICNGMTFGGAIESPCSELTRRTPGENKKRGFVEKKH